MADIKLPKVLYARPDGSHYHADKNCVMLRGGDFELLSYREVTPSETAKRKLTACTCATKSLLADLID